MIVLVVKGKRYLINEKSKASEDECNDILSHRPKGTEFYFDSVKISDCI